MKPCIYYSEPAKINGLSRLIVKIKSKQLNLTTINERLLSSIIDAVYTRLAYKLK